MSPSLQPQLYVSEHVKATGREALTLYSTRLGPGYYDSARVGGILWGTVRSHCMFPQKTCRQRESVSQLGGLWRQQGKTFHAGFSLSGVEFYDIKNTTSNLDQ